VTLQGVGIHSVECWILIDWERREVQTWFPKTVLTPAAAPGPTLWIYLHSRRLAVRSLS
jgi:hypothetical protein